MAALMSLTGHWSKNPCPCRNHKFPNWVYHQNMESTWPAASCFPALMMDLIGKCEISKWSCVLAITCTKSRWITSGKEGPNCCWYTWTHLLLMVRSCAHTLQTCKKPNSSESEWRALSHSTVIYPADRGGPLRFWTEQTNIKAITASDTNIYAK